MSKPSNFAVFLYIAKILFAFYFIWRGASFLLMEHFDWARAAMLILGIGFLFLAWFDPDRQAANRLLFMTPKKREDLEEQERRAAQSAKDRAAQHERTESEPQ